MMIGMTPLAKIAVTIPSEAVEAARKAVASGKAASVSAYVAKALEEKVKLDDLDMLLEELLAESGGPITDSEREAIDREAGWA